MQLESGKKRAANREAGAICHFCRKEMFRPFFQSEGKAVCRHCHAREFLTVTCSGCNSSGWYHPDFFSPECERCGKLEQHCVRCGMPILQVGLTVANGIVCPDCVRRSKTPQPCSVCGEIVILGQDLITCQQAGTMVVAKVVCQKCRDAWMVDTCSLCYKEGTVDGVLCDACYWTQDLLSRLDKDELNFCHDWVVTAFITFCRDLANQTSAKKVCSDFQTYLELFRRCDEEFTDPAIQWLWEVTPVLASDDMDVTEYIAPEETPTVGVSARAAGVVVTPNRGKAQKGEGGGQETDKKD